MTRQMHVLSIVLLQLAAGASPAAAAAPSFPPVVFVSRNPLPDDRPGDVPGIGPLRRISAPGGRLLLRRPDGTLRTLVGGDRLFDVADPCVSWDARRIVFAGTVASDSAWRIYEYSLADGGLRRLTHSDRRLNLSQFGAAAGKLARYDDIDPCYLPDGRIVFASTRYPALATVAAVPVTNLFMMNPDGTDIRRITTERNSAEEPCVDPVTGCLIYSRWWVNPDRPSDRTRDGLSRDSSLALTTDSGNLWQAVSIHPDGDGLKLFAGAPRTREGVQAYKPSMTADGKMLSTYTVDLSPLEGTGGTAVRVFARGPGHPRRITGSMDGTTPYALEPVEIDPTTIAFAWSGDGLDYGIYRSAPDGRLRRKVVDLPGTLEMDPQPLITRKRPPVLEVDFAHHPAPLPPTEDPQTYAQDDFFRFDCMNIFANAGVDVPIPDAPRITRQARIRFFMNIQRQNGAGPDPSILLKDAEVMYHGGVHEHDVPAEVPLFEQVVDSNGRVLRTSDGKFAHVAGFNFERQGAGTKCIGCHTGHSMMDVPINGSLAEWFNLAPSAVASVSGSMSAPIGQRHAAGRLIDRQARTGGDSVVWLAPGDREAAATLTWEIPVEVRAFVLYAVPRTLKQRVLPVADCRIVLFREGIPVKTIDHTGRIAERGTEISIEPRVIDRAEFTLVTRAEKSGTVTGLAEIEAIGRLPRPGADVRVGRR